MPDKFLEAAVTDTVRAAQQHYYGGSPQSRFSPANDRLTTDEIDFIRSRDSFYLATVSETGWPYVQHRGGPVGFLKVVSPNQLAFADFKGNRQLLSTGNLAANNRVCLFLMDYPQQSRLKILGHASVKDAREHPDLVAEFASKDQRSLVERIFFIDLVSFNWNCSQHITPRYTTAEVEIAIAPLRQRILELENKLKNKP